jgi:hypothetical protein
MTYSGNYASSAPALIEPGVKYFFGGVLKECNRLREEYHNAVFNACMLGLFALIAGALLYYKRRSKPTPEEQVVIKRKQREYILSKLRMVNAANHAASRGNFITGLPKWEVPEVELIKNRKIFL